MKSQDSHLRILLILLLTLLGFAVMGYHPGLEDDGVYLAAVKADLNPALFPYNSDFFRIQMQATVFDSAMARFVRATGMPVAWAELFWQLACLFTILWACHGIAQRLFAETRAQWAGVALVAAMFTLPVSGTALFLADQHLHPRNAAAALILLAADRILAARRWQAMPLLFAALLMHPLMAALGISFCVFLTVAMLDSVHARVASWSWTAPRAWRGQTAALIPLGWLLKPASPEWLRALNANTYYNLYKWAWYEWLGALAPLLLFWLLWRAAEKRGEKPLARFALAVFAYGMFQQCLAMVLLAPASWVRLTPFQPMRYLQLVYFAMTLIAGCLLGKYLLKGFAWRWAVYLLAINGGMFAWQLAAFPGSAHLELPGERPANPWLQAFAWIRENTPQNAYFALDPYYLRAPGEDYHGFPALAERSQLADVVKDASVVTEIPELAPRWTRQVEAEQGWNRFEQADFERLRAEFGVDWVLVSYPRRTGLPCPWHNRTLAVCRIP
ncbi:MAG: hypothetical protein WBE72_13595 [Terracidiphilus sp.]